MLKKTLKFVSKSSTLGVVGLLAIVASIGIALVNQGIARADATSDLEAGIVKYQYYKNLFVDNECGLKDDVSGSDIDKFNFYNVWGTQWFHVGLIAQTTDGGYNCGDTNNTSTFTKAAASALGLNTSDPGELLCQLGYKQVVASSSANRVSCADSSTTIGGTDKFHLDNASTAVKNYLLNNSLKGNEPQWTDAMAYWSTLQDFVRGCSAKQVSSGSYGGTVANIRIVNSTGEVQTSGFSFTDSGKAPFSAPGNINNANSTGSCSSLVTGLNQSAPSKYVDAYRVLLLQEACRAVYSTDNLTDACTKGAQAKNDLDYCPNTYRNITAAREACYTGQGNQGAEFCSQVLKYTKDNGLMACIRGSQNSEDPQFCNAEYPAPDALNSSGQLPADTNKSNREACARGQEDPATAGIAVVSPSFDTNAGEQASDAATCGGLIEGIGWILCPILNSVAGLNDAMWGFTSALLTVSPIQQSDGGNYIPQYGGSYTPTYAVWQVFRNIANVTLVIVFLIMIFSQLTGSGISNYGIKKTLPRLIVAAIAINASFFIIQIAVDLFNILGKGIYDIIDNLVPVVQPTWDALIGLVLGGGLTIAGIVGTVAIAPQWALMLLVVPAVTGFIALLAALLTLLFRQAIIPILAVLAPLAFVAYLLPNTKPWFDKWKNLLISMLMLFPLAALLFGGVKLAAAIVMGENSAWGTFAALIILTIPLFMLPFIARQSGPMLGKINSAIKGAGDKLVGKPVGAWADRRKALSLAKSDASKPSNYNLLKRARQGLGKSRKRTELRTEAYKAQGTADYNSSLAENAGALAESVEGSAAQAYIRGAGARAEAEELKLAMVPLEQEIADVRAGKHKTFNGTNVDDFLEERARDESRSGSEREAAMQKAAALGRDQVVRNLLYGNKKTGAAKITDQAALQRAVTANAGALAGKAPDLVKGSSAAAFKSFTGADMASWSEGTAKQFVSHIESLAASGDIEGVNAALANFATASKDIQNNPTLQGQFSADAGKAFRDDIAALAKANPKLAGIDSAFVSIGPDGKIR